MRTIIRRTKTERWNDKAIEDIVATPLAPNQKDEEQEKVEPESKTEGAKVDGESGIGTKEPEPAEEHEVIYRDFKITRQVLEMLGLVMAVRDVKQHYLAMRHECITPHAEDAWRRK